MDNFTHGLWGIGIYGAWAASQPHWVHSPLTTTVFVAAVLGSEAPDADYIVKLTKGPAAYLKQHRSISHSLPACLFWALMITVGLSLWEPHHFGLLFCISLIGVVTHVLLDVLTPYGTQALWPITNRRFKLDVLFTIDPVFIVLAVFGILLTIRGGNGRLIVGWCFAIAALYILCRAAYASWLSARLDEHYPSATKTSVIPQIVPWWWAYVVETETSIEGGVLTRNGPKRQELRWLKPTDQTALLATWTMANTHIGRLFTGFARHLIWQVKRDGAVEQVYLADATYRFGNWLPFAVCISVLKGNTGDWVIGSEIIRGQSVDFCAIGEDMKNKVPRTLSPKIPTEHP